MQQHSVNLERSHWLQNNSECKVMWWEALHFKTIHYTWKNLVQLTVLRLDTAISLQDGPTGTLAAFLTDRGADGVGVVTCWGAGWATLHVHLAWNRTLRRTWKNNKYRVEILHPRIKIVNHSNGRGIYRSYTLWGLYSHTWKNKQSRTFLYPRNIQRNVL